MQERHNTREIDALVVGSGPAGSAAAAILAKRGVPTLLLEKRTFPRPKLCGGLLTWKSMQALGRVFGLDESAATNAGLFEYVTPEYEIFHQQRRLVRGAYEYPFHLVERGRFDQALRERAQAAGCLELLEDAELVSLDPQTGQAELADGRRIKAKLCIAADGVNSRVRRFCGFNEQAWRRNLAACIEIAVPRARLDQDWDRPTLYVGYVRAGYCWAFPNKEKVLFGVCDLLRSRSNLAEQFRTFLRAVDVPEDIPFHGHPLPYGNYLERPAQGRALLVGDAAGLVEPLFGEGIYYALRSGELAGEAAATALERGASAGVNQHVNAAAAYVASIQDELHPELVAARRLRTALYLVERALKHAPLTLFLRGGGAKLVETVHGMRSYRWFKPIHVD
jgi:geranylgeranyl reductase family protein